ncbi:ficolin-1-like [Antedon mediterranea]|uniref:ficolin-1-like n=1 Tax=Antedon mediterranea TaxID=105859 RepID=UPI003AF564E2
MLVRLIVLSLMVAKVHSNSHVTKEQDGCHCTVVVKNGCGNEETCSNEKGKPRDCTEVLDRDSQAQSGEYTIDPHDGGKPIRVYCDMVTDGGGWTVFQRREDGTTDFYRGWAAYKSGFGNVNSEHWLGNDNIYRITSAGHFEMRVDMTSFDGESAYARYENFRLGDESTNYKLVIGTYSGDAGNSLSGHGNKPFSTSDQDNDENESSSCAVTYKGAWWYTSCHSSNLNGLYLEGETEQFATGVVWKTWKTYYYSLKTTEMKIRRLL